MLYPGCHHHIQPHLVFISSSFIVMQLKFRSVIHFELIFVMGIRSISRFSFLHVLIISSCFSTSCGTIFAPLCCLHSFVKDQLPVFMCFRVSALCCVICCVLFHQSHTVLITLGLYVLELDNVSPPT